MSTSKDEPSRKIPWVKKMDGRIEARKKKELKAKKDKKDVGQ